MWLFLLCCCSLWGLIVTLWLPLRKSNFLHLYNKSFLAKATQIYPKGFKTTLFTVVVVLLFFMVYCYDNQLDAENDAIVNGEKNTVKITGLSYGKNIDIYFRYEGAVSGIRLNYYDANAYHAGDSITVLHSKKFDNFFLYKPSMVVKTPSLEIACILFVVVVFWLIFTIDKKIFVA